VFTILEAYNTSSRYGEDQNLRKNIWVITIYVGNIKFLFSSVNQKVNLSNNYSYGLGRGLYLLTVLQEKPLT